VLSAASASPISVTVSTVDGTATSGDDYSALATVLNFPPGVTSQPVSVSILDDTLVGGLDSGEALTEDFQVSLSSPSGAVLGPSSAGVTILDDDPVAVGCTPSGTAPTVGPPDGVVYNLECGTEIIIDLPVALVADGDSGIPDFVFYEAGLPTAANNTNVQLDWVIVQVRVSPADPWYTVFYFGDGVLDLNSNVGQAILNSPPLPFGSPCPIAMPYAQNEAVNKIICAEHLYSDASNTYHTGITIDIDGLVAPGQSFTQIRFYSPSNNPDSSQIDSVELLP
jgi:hypothetical protein